MPMDTWSPEALRRTTVPSSVQPDAEAAPALDTAQVPSVSWKQPAVKATPFAKDEVESEPEVTAPPPDLRLSPPVERDSPPWKVEVPFPLTFMNPPIRALDEDSMTPVVEVAIPAPIPPVIYAEPDTERSWAGVVEPIPNLPVSVMRRASVRRPALRVENARDEVPPPKFCHRVEVRAAVEVGAFEVSRERNTRREAVEVAEASFVR